MRRPTGARALTPVGRGWAPVVAAALTLVVLGAGNAPTLGAAAGDRHPVAGGGALPATEVERATVSCDASRLSELTLSSPKLSALPLSGQVVHAQARNGCGAPLSGVAYRWALVPADLGGLNESTGSTVLYSSCYVPMSGTLSVTATYLGTSVTNLTFVTVGPTDNASPAPSPSGLSASGSARTIELGVALAFVLAGAIVGARAWDQSRRGRVR